MLKLIKIRKGQKGQIEAIGLAVVFVLVAVGLLIALQIMGKAKAKPYQKFYKEAELPKNFLNTLVASKTTCQGKTFAEVIDACATARDLDCNLDGYLGDECEFLQINISSILDNFFNKIGIDYRFKITLKGIQNEELIVINNTPCLGKKDLNYISLPIASGNAVVDITLEICY